jgi:8-oxo-dGTP pyrophosphatase MutT (NUDIX family)
MNAIHLQHPNWRTRIEAAVSPLGSGVQPLRINGYRPPGVSSFRPARTAAVLVPVLDLAEPEIVLTKRAEHLSQHAGQISFPGGAAEQGDDSAVQTALREAYEEIGLPANCTTPIGFLDRLDTISDYRVLPVVALVKGRVEWKLDRSEVSEVFTVPLSFALDKARYVPMNVKRDGAEWTIWSLEWQQYRIWGATAAILFNLATRFEQTHEP